MAAAVAGEPSGDVGVEDASVERRRRGSPLGRNFWGVW